MNVQIIMDWPMCIGEEFTRYHHEDYLQAKFKIGEIISLNRKDYPKLMGRFFTVSGVEYADNNEDGTPIFEYSLRGFSVLCWEWEMDKV